MEKVLFIEDETALAEIIKESLEAKGFEVRHAVTLAKARLLYQQYHPDIIVADVMLPDGDGFEWISSIRKSDTITPVIFLTSRSQTADVVKGFELGGNDYLKKPFSIAELIVRMESLLKREPKSALQQKKETYSCAIGHFTFQFPAGELQYGHQIRQLTSREADLLHYLLLHRNSSVSRADILHTLWGNTDYFSGRSLDVFISKLRRYFSADSSVKIMNVRGIGYKIIC
jgi:DNA-binding response OmpR family regulator